MSSNTGMATPPETPDPGRTYGGETAADRLARQRQQFLDAGLTLFGSIGYRATTVRLLCKQAGLIDRYFYKNFSDTEELLAAIYTESMDQIQAEVMAALTAALPSGDTERIVTAGLDTFFKAFENARVARVCWLEVLGVSPRIDALYTRRIEQFTELLISVAQRLLPRWPASNDEAHYIAMALIGGVTQSAAHWLLSGYRAPRKVLVTANALLLRSAMGALG